MKVIAFFLAETFEIGVHIADVSYFVKEGTALDVTAADRATSVYLVQEVSVCVCVCVWSEESQYGTNFGKILFKLVLKCTEIYVRFAL